VQTLCDASGVGATWNRDGVILFTDGGSLYRVSDSGGTPKLVAARNAAFAGYLLPQFLPDGRHFLVLARASALGAATATATVKVGSLVSKKTVSLIEGSSDAFYVRPGYLFYVQRGNLVARGFDARSLKFTGQAVPVAENISVANASWAPFSVTFTPALNLSPAWSKDGSRIYFSSDRNGKHGIYEKPADGLGNTQQVLLSSQGYAYLNYLSPDGHYAMFMTISPALSEWALPLSGRPPKALCLPPGSSQCF